MRLRDIAAGMLKPIVRTSSGPTHLWVTTPLGRVLFLDMSRPRAYERADSGEWRVKAGAWSISEDSLTTIGSIGVGAWGRDRADKVGVDLRQIRAKLQRLARVA